MIVLSLKLIIINLIYLSVVALREDSSITKWRPIVAIELVFCAIFFD